MVAGVEKGRGKENQSQIVIASFAVNPPEAETVAIRT